MIIKVTRGNNTKRIFYQNFYGMLEEATEIAIKLYVELYRHSFGYIRNGTNI